MKKTKVIIQLKSKKSKVIICQKSKKSKEIRHFNVQHVYEKAGNQSRQLGFGFPFILLLIAFYNYFFQLFLLVMLVNSQKSFIFAACFT